MDAPDEEGSPTGKLKPGQWTVAGVVTQDVFDALTALRAERGIPTTSKAVGEALREWAHARATAGFKPLAGGGGTPAGSGGDTGLKPSESREVTLSSWQEIRGRVTEIADEGRHMRLALEDKGSVVVVHLPASFRAPGVRVGATVAILRTDDPVREYLVREDGRNSPDDPRAL